MPPADQEGLGETDEHYKEGVVRLQDFIYCNEYSNNVCLVCLEAIAPGAAVWTCRDSCFCMLHLVCAQGWANQQLKAAAAKAASQAANPDLYASGPGMHSFPSLTSENACHSFAEPQHWLRQYADILLDLQANVHIAPIKAIANLNRRLHVHPGSLCCRRHRIGKV